MKDKDLILKGWRKCCLFCCITGAATLLLRLVPGVHLTDFGAGMGYGELVFGATSYLFSRLGVVP